jgi:hypothetical protein
MEFIEWIMLMLLRSQLAKRVPRTAVGHAKSLSYVRVLR